MRSLNLTSTKTSSYHAKIFTKSTWVCSKILAIRVNRFMENLHRHIYQAHVQGLNGDRTPPRQRVLHLALPQLQLRRLRLCHSYHLKLSIHMLTQIQQAQYITTTIHTCIIQPVTILSLFILDKDFRLKPLLKLFLFYFDNLLSTILLLTFF